MKHGKLRIAWSVGWGVVAVLLCVLWLRSYWWTASITRMSSSTVLTMVIVNYGKFALLQNDFSVIPPRTPGPSRTPHGWQWQSVAATPLPFKFAWVAEPTSLSIRFPMWFAVSLVAILSAAAWVPGRFSLRTLFIATTLVAVGLGMIVWASAH